MSHEIEARLERSLRKQVRAPRLDGRFDAAVWSRIEAESSGNSVPAAQARPAAARWLFAINVFGVVSTLALVAYFALPMLPAVDVTVAVPEVSTGFVERAVEAIKWPVTILALAFGLMFTNFGKRLRSELF